MKASQAKITKSKPSPIFDKALLWGKIPNGLSPVRETPRPFARPQGDKMTG